MSRDRSKDRIIGVSGKTDKAIRRAARSARRESDAGRRAAESVQAASGRTGGRTDGTYGGDSSVKLVLWCRAEGGNPTSLLSTFLDDSCSMTFRYYAGSRAGIEQMEFWIEIIWLNKIVGVWEIEPREIEMHGENQVTGLLTWKAEDE